MVHDDKYHPRVGGEGNLTRGPLPEDVCGIYVEAARLSSPQKGRNKMVSLLARLRDEPVWSLMICHAPVAPSARWGARRSSRTVSSCNT